MKISIIVPNYNNEKFIYQCLDSLVNQTYKDLEIIVIDDGSTDGSFDIIKRFAKRDSRIIAVHQSNAGVSATRNRALDFATGDYIGFVDGDDYALPEMYQEMVDLLERNDSDVSICTFANIKNSYNGPDLVMSPQQAIYNINEGTYFRGHLHNKLYRRELWNNIRLDENIAICEDTLVNHYLFAKAKKIVFQNIPLYYYRTNPEGALNTKKFNPKYLTVLDAYKEMSSFIVRNNMDANGLSSMVLFNGYHMALRKLYDTTERNEYKDEKKNCLIGYRENFRMDIFKKRGLIVTLYMLGLRGGYIPYKAVCKTLNIEQKLKHIFIRKENEHE